MCTGCLIGDDEKKHVKLLIGYDELRNDQPQAKSLLERAFQTWASWQSVPSRA